MIQEPWSSSKRTRGAMHSAQTTERVKTILTQECQTTLKLVPPGATSKVQPLDVTFNAEFKKSVDRLATEHLSANSEHFMTGKVTAGDRRVLFTKWVGTAWQETSAVERHSYSLICEMRNFTTHLR